ncbi:MAG: segregation/condensation protein A [Erysipelotrichaceae bacterium]|nr:segregation/condensation protein A [Erysipelotrichaceae bacterium]
MSFLANIEQFEGPLDLMLHLIKEQELDIFDLDLDILTKQYLLYIEEMENLELEVESEYLVELATLVEYKSKKLLPKDESKIEDEYEEDPKERLVRRLLEYQKYKEVSKTLYDAYSDRSFQLSKPISDGEEFKVQESNSPYDGNPNDLLKAMSRVIRRLELSKPIETKYTSKELSVDDRILAIKARLKDLDDTFSFEKLVDDCKEVHEVIVTFLAVLDLAKNHILFFSTDDNDNIWFTRGDN